MSEKSMEERVRRLEDLEAIQELFRQYSYRFDHRDLVGWSELWALDGEWHGPNMHGVGGPPGVLKMMRDRGFRDGEPTGEVHVVGNPVITLEGSDRAHATSFGIVLRPGEDGTPRLTMIGFYTDDLIRGSDGQWLFQVRRDYLNTPPYLTEEKLGPPTTWTP